MTGACMERRPKACPSDNAREGAAGVGGVVCFLSDTHSERCKKGGNYFKIVLKWGGGRLAGACVEDPDLVLGIMDVKDVLCWYPSSWPCRER